MGWVNVFLLGVKKQTDYGGNDFPNQATRIANLLY